jgi:NAD(P)-dependent dehydrogenase (short-subunit alcohol dehydrogenase family)
MSERDFVTIVTGGSGNLGRATVALLAQRGHRVVAVDRAAWTLDAVRDAPERHEALVEADLSLPEAAERVVARALDRFGRLDGVVNTVGGFAMAPIADSGLELWEQMFRINVLTTLNVFRAAIARMRVAGRGSLVAIAAAPALRAPAGMSAYAAAKSGVIRLVESFAEELKPDRVRVNAILPSIIDTPQNRAAMPDADHSRWVRPEELANVIAFLLSDSASAVTAASIGVPGAT